jgi:WD40 repeat protein
VRTLAKIRTSREDNPRRGGGAVNHLMTTGRVAFSILLVAVATGKTRAADPPDRKPEVWAVIVAIDGYNDAPRIPACQGAIRSGRRLTDWLIKTAHWQNQHILNLNENGVSLHGAPADQISVLAPTGENLKWAVTRWLAHRVRPNDLVVIYYAGQAAVTRERTVLLPIDAKADDLERTGWALEDSIDVLASKGCTVVLWLDTSPRGRSRAATPSKAADQDPLAGTRFLNRLTRWPGVTAWLAADGAPAVDGPAGTPFLSALTAGLGTARANLLACLDLMEQDPALAKQGFRTRGGIAPDLTLWPAELLPEHRIKAELLVQQGHADGVSALATAPGGEIMVTASKDSTVRIWRVRDRESVLLRVLPYHMIGVTALSMGGEGQYLATGDGAGQVRIWDWIEHQEKAREGPPPHQSRIAQIAVLPGKNGSQFVSLDQDGRTMAWDATGPVMRVKPLLSEDVLQLSAARRVGGAALALARADGKIVLIGDDGQSLRAPLEGTRGRSTALDLAPDGLRVAIGDEDGHVRVCDVPAGTLLARHVYDRGIGAVRFDVSGNLAVVAGGRLSLCAPGEAGPGVLVHESPHDMESVVFSPDGAWLAALNTAGDHHLWSLADRRRPEERPLKLEGRSAGIISIAFARDSSRLIAGEADGGVRSWELGNLRERPRIASHRGKIDRLAASADGRYLLEITHDGQGLVWDLKHGREPQTLPGEWTSAAFLPDATQLVLTRKAQQGGDVVRVDRATGKILAVYERPRAREHDRPSQVTFDRVTVTSDGRKVAALSAPGHDELACVWDIRGGPPRLIRGHIRSLSAISFSKDGRLFLTASEDGTAKLWDLERTGPDGELPHAQLPDPAARVTSHPRSITAAQISPVDSRRVVTAQRLNDQVSVVTIWDCEPGKAARPRPLGEIQGKAHAIVFAPDGRWVGVAGQDRVMRFWVLEDGRLPARVEFEARHQHTEQVHALIAWPSPSMFVSAGDDTSVRFWTIDPKARRARLIGSLVAFPAVRVETAPLQQAARGAVGADWVAFTPDGMYDSSLNGDRLVSFVQNREVRPLEQFAARFCRFGLTDQLRQGIRPEPPAFTPPPTLVIDPPSVIDLPARGTELRISLLDASVNAESLRLYQNGVPVREGGDFRRVGSKGEFVVPVRLRSGVNRFYAMAARNEDVDARSQDVELHYDRSDTPTRVHVLALGVKSYGRNALRFADVDARQMADHIQRYGVGDASPPGKAIVLTDANVTARNVEDAFSSIRREVRGRPEDLVVVFLAGHTDVLKSSTGRERFSLLLKDFPFSASEPLLAANRGVGLGAATGANLPTGADLPFYAIYRNLSNLDALHRLIIIDACQAEAIYDDPGVRQVEQFRLNESESRKTRTSYILAARRGELANESDVLGHGLLTYVLLRGMDASGLYPLPKTLTDFDPASNADGDRDGVVTTCELREYADRGMVALAKHLPGLAQRGRSEAIDARRPLPEHPSLQASEAIFELVVLPKNGRTE